uniref:Uncharacterized protein n=1 Tax=Arundo donax TaxID=35708 RepID=A0A0A8ZDR8_ARUDO
MYTSWLRQSVSEIGDSGVSVRMSGGVWDPDSCLRWLPGWAVTLMSQGLSLERASCGFRDPCGRAGARMLGGADRE